MSTVDDLTLVLLSPERGRPSSASQGLPAATAGAVLLDLALAGRLSVHPAPGGKTGKGRERLQVVAGPPTGDVLLDAALDRLGPDDRSARSAVTRTGRYRLPGQARDGLVERGLARREPGGFLRLTRWYPQAAARDELVGVLRAALTGKGPVDARAAAVLPLLQALRAVPRAVPGTGLGRRELAERCAEVGAGGWAGPAVDAVVQAVQAGTTAAVVSAVAAGAAGAA